MNALPLLGNQLMQWALRWADKHPEVERVYDDYGALLTFAKSELREAFRGIALDLAA